MKEVFGNAESSSGRTSDFGSDNEGSNPSLATKIFTYIIDYTLIKHIIEGRVK